MTWIDELEKDAWNLIIDELVWHLREGRKPVAVRRLFTPKAGVEFCFEAAQPVFFAVEQILFEAHWNDALAIIGQCPELSALKMYDA